MNLRLLAVALLAILACAPAAQAILVIDTPEGRVWVWQQAEMESLKRDLTELYRENAELRDQVGKPKVCL